MPGAVIAAVVGHIVTGAAVSAGLVAAGSIGAAIIGGAASFAANTVFSAVFSDAPDAPREEANFEQEQGALLSTIRQPITHWQWIYGRTRVGGALTFLEQSSDKSVTHLVITLAGHVCTEIESIRFDDEIVPLDGSGNATGRYAGYVSIQKSLGDEAGQPFPGLVAESAGKWTDAHRQTGRTKIWVRLTRNRDLFPRGMPNITAVVKGRKVYDPRSGLTAWSDNASLCIADLICNGTWLGADYDTEVDETQLVAAANIDDESVSLAGGGTEARYTLNGAFPVNADSRTMLERMLSANAGRVYYLAGTYRIHPAAYATPTITFSEADLRAVPQIQPRLSAAELCNGVKGVYVSEDHYWQPTDFPPVTNATYLAEDQGERSWRELDLPFTKSAATAQRIAKIELERARQQIGVTWPGKFTCFRVQPGDSCGITFSMMGWTAKVYEIQGGSLALEDDGEGGVRIGYDMSLRETAAAVYDWSSGEETEVDPAPDTGLPDPFDVAAPGAPAVVEQLYETGAERRVASRAVVSWMGGDARSALYELQYRLAAASAWTTHPRTSGTSVELLDLLPGTYEFRVKGVSEIGVSSAWSPTTTKEVLGLSARPDALADLTIQKLGSQALITFTQSADLDVRRGGRILVRHSEATSGATWEGSFSIGNERGYPGDAVYVLVPLKAGTYLLKPEDTSGQQAETAATIASDGATALTWSPLASVTEDATFPGTHSNTVVASGALKLAGTGLFDDIPDFDDISDLDSYGGIAAAGTYTFSAGIDLGAKTPVQLYSELEGLTENVNDLIDEREDDIDDWLDFDGTGGGGTCDAWVEVRATDDNPAGSPVWGAWNRLDVSEYDARAFQFRLRMTSNDPSYNLLVSRLRVYAQEVA